MMESVTARREKYARYMDRHTRNRFSARQPHRDSAEIIVRYMYVSSHSHKNIEIHLLARWISVHTCA